MTISTGENNTNKYNYGNRCKAYYLRAGFVAVG
jgi:hypothetical protein